VCTSSGKLTGCTSTSPDGHVVPDATRPLAACNFHSSTEIKNALSRHYPGMEQAEDLEEPD
jgi:hypothetical protein